jgi:hypothetical protein
MAKILYHEPSAVLHDGTGGGAGGLPASAPGGWGGRILATRADLSGPRLGFCFRKVPVSCAFFGVFGAVELNTPKEAQETGHFSNTKPQPRSTYPPRQAAGQPWRMEPMF